MAPDRTNDEGGSGKWAGGTNVDSRVSRTVWAGLRGQVRVRRKGEGEGAQDSRGGRRDRCAQGMRERVAEVAGHYHEVVMVDTRSADSDVEA